MIQSSYNPCGIDFFEHTSSTQVTTTLLRQPAVDVARSCAAVLDLAIGSNAETLFRTLMGFCLGHGFLDPSANWKYRNIKYSGGYLA